MVDVALRPSEVRAADPAIVIDVLRATSTVTQALAGGYERVLYVASLARAEPPTGAAPSWCWPPRTGRRQS
jgi:phosphosulfolactate phosphohydrolase-like enzyme